MMNTSCRSVTLTSLMLLSLGCGLDFCHGFLLSTSPSMATSRLSLQPDGFRGDGFNDRSINPNVNLRDSFYRPNINPEAGGAMQRFSRQSTPPPPQQQQDMNDNMPYGYGPPDGMSDEEAQSMIRMDASATRRNRFGPSTVQGSGSRATYVSPDPYGFDEMNIHLGTEGRPLYANVEHWSGPNNVPSKMQLYSEDGAARPWRTKFRTPTNIDSGVTQIRNVGPMEFPIQASVQASNSYPYGDGDMSSQQPYSDTGRIMPGGNLTPFKTIDGGSLKTFGFDADIEYVYLEITSEGLPVHAKVELWQGPSNTKAIGKIYTDHGLKRPWSAMIPLQGVGASICVLNEGPMEYPIEVRMDPPPRTEF